MELNEKEALKVMIDFLDNYYNQTKADDVAVLLGSLTLLDDGKPADAAMWGEWLDAIHKVKEK
ncbi:MULTISPECIES: hypothetical protein [Sporolactobacillus]|uniref:Uncharacterized protein n=1 Tax=Sporolactobacillus terrae TaxID=269673 RepID=A0ABX5Q4K6_9BACL|nr:MULTISPECIES: hypothetical protein [Sporolactobacillus]QAA21586.1 hypothetical protein C0674_02515 [Sporolactobacillus terrae]QAA24558.1 hypothetical protein C0679_02495 [Sporolactobacillus terrae]RYL87081.1 hypothetical protein EWH91_13390 [Sporolactobacillus sp. THM19-2]